MVIARSIATRSLIVLLVSLLLHGTAFAQTKKKTMRIGEPSSIGVAMVGTAMVGLGAGIMLYQDACTENCPTNVPYVVGGMSVVAAGITMVYLGLRPKTVIIAPMVTPKMMGVAAIIRWPRR